MEEFDYVEDVKITPRNWVCERLGLVGSETKLHLT